MTKAEAELAAYKLIAQMHTTGWKARVWENCGWHYAIILGYMQVYGSPDGTYFASFATQKGAAGTLCGWADSKTDYRDPNEAVRQQYRKAREVVTGEMAVILEQGKLLSRSGRGRETHENQTVPVG